MEAKFKVGDLIVWNNLLGRITAVMFDSKNKIYLYKLGTCTSYVEEKSLTLADHRDKLRIAYIG